MAFRQIGVTKSWIGLSTDTKPVTVDIGDGFYEYDTRNAYIYSTGGWALYKENISDTPLAFWGTCGSTMTSSTTILVIPDLVGYGNDLFNTKYYAQVIYNNDAPSVAPENQLRKITDYSSTSGTFVCDAFTAKVNASDKILVVHESLVVQGRDDADNVFSSANVVSNRDGSLLERTEFIIDAILGGLHFRTEQSHASTVEENGMQAFNISVFDVDSGAVNATAIDITSISSVMWKSDAGAAFATTGITQPVFTAAAGRIYSDYQFLAAEWAVGDLYKLVVSGITVTVDADVLYVPTMVWSNAVLEAEDLDTMVEGLVASMSTALSEINLVQATLSTALSEINLAQATLSTVISEINLVQATLSTVLSEINLVQATLSTTLTEIDLTQATLSTHTASLGTLTNEVDLVQATLSTALSEINLVQATLSTTLSEINLAQASLSTALTEIDLMQASIATANANIVISLSETDLVQATLSTALSEINLVQASIATCLTEIDLTQATLSTVISEINLVQATLSTALTEINLIQASLSTVISEIDLVQATLSTAISEINLIQASISTALTEIDLVQTTLSTALSEINLIQASLVTANAGIITLETGLEGGTNAVNRAMGKTQYFEKEVTSVADAGNVTIATTTATACNIKSIAIMSNGATSASLTTIDISGGTSKVVPFITGATRASLDAIDKQVTWQGNKVLRADAARGAIVATLTGTAASPVDITIFIEYEAVHNGGYLA